MKTRPRLHKFMHGLLMPLVKLYIRLCYGFVPDKKLSSKEPLIILANHTTNVDFLFVAASLKQDVYFVASEHSARAGFLSNLLKFFFEPIFHDKANVGISTVMGIRRQLKAGHHVCIFAEGMRSFNGQSFRSVASTAAVAQKMRVKVATLRIHGGYFTSPSWSDSRRKGKMSSEWVNKYSNEELKNFSKEDFTMAVNEDLFVDAYLDNAKQQIAYRGKNLAKGIEYVLVACPNCHKINSLKSEDDRFFCDCGLHGTYDEFGYLTGEGFFFRTITEWDKWQRHFISEIQVANKSEIYCQDTNQILKEILPDHSTKIITRGNLSITPEKLVIGDEEFYFQNIRRLNMILQGYLLFSTKDDRFFEIRNPEKKYAGYLYILLMEHFSGRSQELTDRLY